MNTEMYKFVIDGIAYDNRTLETTKEQKIKILRELTTQNIIEFEGIDLFTQINASLSIYNEERSEEIKNKISYWVNRYNAAKIKVLYALSNDEIDNIIL